MRIPFFSKRLPFELAEPGVDPTRLPNPHPTKDWREVIPWVLAGVALLVFGYWKFIYKPPPKPRAEAAATATPTVEPTLTPGTPSFFSQSKSSGFFPTPLPSVVTDRAGELVHAVTTPTAPPNGVPRCEMYCFGCDEAVIEELRQCNSTCVVVTKRDDARLELPGG